MTVDIRISEIILPTSSTIGADLSGFRFLKIQVFQGPSFWGSKVQVQVSEAALKLIISEL